MGATKDSGTDVRDTRNARCLHFNLEDIRDVAVGAIVLVDNLAGKVAFHEEPRQSVHLVLRQEELGETAVVRVRLAVLVDVAEIERERDGATLQTQTCLGDLQIPSPD